MVAIPNELEAGEIIAALREANPALSILARGHSDTEVRHLLEHGADAGFATWESGYDPSDPVDAAVMATRKAVFPLLGLDPWFD